MFDDYFIQEEFIFPEEGGVTGTREVDCPHCGMAWELPVRPGETCDLYECSHCRGSFGVDWVQNVVRHFS
jgi:hypothetical protein